MSSRAENTPPPTSRKTVAPWSAAVEAEEARAAVLDGLRPLLEGGDATLQPIQGGALELRLLTGEVFHLDDAGITRVS